MLIIYEPDKKDKNTLDFLKVDMITIKILLHLVSLPKKTAAEQSFRYFDTFFLCYAMDLLSDSYLDFCNCFWIVLVHMVF